MKSVAARLAVWYSAAATITLAGLSVVGFYALQNNLVHGLDLLNTAEFNRIEAHLGSDYSNLSSVVIDNRIRESTEAASVLFYIVVHDKNEQSLFNSANLRGQTISDLAPQAVFNTMVPSIGELRVGKFSLGPLNVMVATPLKQVRDLLRVYVQVSIALVSLMLIVSISIGFGLGHLALRPVYIIEETVNRISFDNLSERIPIENIESELANMAQLLNQTFDRLESAFKQISRFTAEASHELKTPLSLMRLQAERMIMEGGLSNAHEELMQMQLEEIARLNNIVEELLLISRAEAGAITLQRAPHEPTDFLHGFAQDARALSEHRGLRYVDSHEGSGMVSFDSQWIRQVLLNLLKNALTASPVNGIIAIRSELSAHTWRVMVEDQGAGVPTDAYTKIFERFVRLNGSDHEGSGLGLAICVSIIALHKGRIWAEQSSTLKGLRVTFELPTADAAPLDTPHAHDVATLVHSQWKLRGLWQRLRINLRGHQQRDTD